MEKLKRKILNILFWIALAVGVIMVLWRIFGSSPSDLAIIIPFVVMGLMKIWSNNDKIKNIEHQVRILSINTKSSFAKVKENMENIGKNINEIKTKIDNLSNKKIKNK